MKTIKSYLALGLATLSLIGLNSCIDDDSKFEFVAQEPVEGIAFTSDFLSEYVLTQDASSNIAERFVWNMPDFGVPTPVNYELYGAPTMDFTDATTLGSTDETNLGVTVSQMLALAEEAGLDNDPSTADMPNSGQIYFQVKASVGTGGSNAPDSTSEAIALTVVLPEDTGGGGSGVEVSSWGVVGSGYNEWGASPDAPFYTTADAGVIVSYVSLIDGEIKFRENNDWASDLGDDGTDGTLEPGGANIPVTAGDYKITIDLNDNTYTIEAFTWGIVGSATPNAWDGPDIPLTYDYMSDSWKAVAQLVDGEMKFRQNNEWGNDYGDTGADGSLELGGDNIVVSAGYYLITVDFNNLTYTVEETQIWGVVGSATPNGWDGPDTKLSPDFANPGVWTLDNITLIDGELKFRPNDTWGEDYGDADGDNVLDRDDDNNIAVSAGTYSITINFSDAAAPTYSLTAQ